MIRVFASLSVPLAQILDAAEHLAVRLVQVGMILCLGVAGRWLFAR
jgi:hypothetical protein